MTYQEKYEQLHNEFAEKSGKYLNADRELSSVNGFFDGSLLNNFAIAKSEFEIAGNNYHLFLTFAKANNASSTDIFPNS